MSCFQLKKVLHHRLRFRACCIILVLFICSVSAVSVQWMVANENSEPITTAYNVLHVTTNTMEMNQPDQHSPDRAAEAASSLPAKSQQLKQSFENYANINNVMMDTFTRMVQANWTNGYLLLQLSEVAEDLDFKILVYEILYKSLRPTKKIYNPFVLLELYRQVDAISFQLCHAQSNNYSDQQRCSKITDVRSKLRTSLIMRCAQILEGYFHLQSQNCSNRNVANPSSIVQNILNKLNTLQDNDIFAEIMDQVFDAVQDLITDDVLVRFIGNFSINPKQNIVANVQLLARLPKITEATATTLAIQSNPKLDVRRKVKENLKFLLRNFLDFRDQLEPEWRKRIYSSLPASVHNLYLANKICIRNSTDATRYLYECPQTYLICTNTKDTLHKATFTVEHNLEQDTFAFRSLHWTNRYLSIENNTENMLGKTLAVGFVKNVYSTPNAHYWQTEWHGDNVALFDPLQKMYLCAGRPSSTNDENHAYTRPAQQYENFKRECQWFIEDCSGI